jgi:hypothetical protein
MGEGELAKSRWRYCDVQIHSRRGISLERNKGHLYQDEEEEESRGVVSSISLLCVSIEKRKHTKRRKKQRINSGISFYLSIRVTSVAGGLVYILAFRLYRELYTILPNSSPIFQSTPKKGGNRKSFAEWRLLAGCYIANLFQRLNITQYCKEKGGKSLGDLPRWKIMSPSNFFSAFICLHNVKIPALGC